jgi:ABC-2 type transport system permease protein
MNEQTAMQLGHSIQALRAVTTREIIKFLQQRGRLLSALVRPLMWLAVFAAGFYNVFGVSIIPPYKTYVTYQVYIVPGLLGIIRSSTACSPRSPWSMTARWA